MKLYGLALTVALTVLPVCAQKLDRTTGPHIDFQVLMWTDAPAQIVGTRSHLTHGMTGFYLLNVSDRTVTKAQLGWVVAEKDRPGTVMLGLPFDRTMPPGEFELVETPGLSQSTVKEIIKVNGIKEPVVAVAVVYAKFSDGGEWAYPLALKRRFETKHRKDPAINERLVDSMRRLHEELQKQANEENESTSKDPP